MRRETIAFWTPFAYGLGAVVAYEVIRGLVVGAVRRWMKAGATQFVRQHRVQLELARFVDRVWMRERLASDRLVEGAILEANRTTGKPIPALRDKVDGYVDEIAPYFSISSYYQFGIIVARRFVEFCFELVVDHAGFEEQATHVPEGAVRVYVMNHRSNVDPLVISHGLVHQIALSYAVGEWALVWPLSSLFRSFGSYFVRRGEPDPLYHTVLERFVQLLAGQGAVTGFFPEGGLSRDGALRRPRTGLLEYLIKLRNDYPNREIVFLPVGLNYDRVIEDRTLVAERDGKPKKPMLLVRLFNLGALLFWLPWLIVANLLRVATRSHHKFGYAAISFGKPLRLTEWPGGAGIHALPDEERKIAVRNLATELLYHRIAKVVPITPVAATCLALLREGSLEMPAVTRRIQQVIGEFRKAGAPIAFGSAFDALRERHRANSTASHIPGLDQAVDDSDEAELVLRLSLHQLMRRRVVWRRRGVIELLDRPVVEYYANSVIHHVDPGIFERRDAEHAG